MNEDLERLTEAYAAGLRAYLNGQGEAALLNAYEVGRAALAAKLSVLELTAVHQVALVRTLLEKLAPGERTRIESMAADYSSESLVPFELTVRGAHEANAVLQRLNQALAEKNAEIQRQLEAVRSLELLKDDLMSLLVHDLRNPLAGMISCLDLLKPRPGDSEYDATLEIVKLAREGARKQSELLEDLLEVRKLEEGKLPLRLELVRLSELVDEAISTHTPTARLEEVHLELDTVDPFLTLEVDRRLIRRVVENLISNALKFSRAHGSVSISVRAVEDRVVLEVKDRGPGVAEELRDRLFQKFGSVEAKTAGGRRGFGLGLYVVRLVATAHGGSVEVAPREGGGTIFRVMLPRMRSPA